MEQKSESMMYPALTERRRGERRQGASDASLAAAGLERRRGDRRRVPVAVTLGALVLVSGLATPALAGKGTPAPATATAVSNPLSGARWYVDPYSNAKRTADSWRSTRPLDATQMDKVAANPQADWFGGWRAATSCPPSTAA
jgi:hypothetical protein